MKKRLLITTLLVAGMANASNTSPVATQPDPKSTNTTTTNANNQLPESKTTTVSTQPDLTSVDTTTTSAVSTPWYRVDQHTKNLWNNWSSTTVDAATVYCAMNPERVGNVAAAITEHAITLNGRYRTPNHWDGPNGDTGIKAWFPTAVTVFAFGRIAQRWNQVSNRPTTTVTTSVAATLPENVGTTENATGTKQE